MTLKSFQEEYARTVESVATGVTTLKPFECAAGERDQLIQMMGHLIELLKIGERVSDVLNEAEPKGAIVNGAKGVRSKASAPQVVVTTTADPNEGIRF